MSLNYDNESLGTVRKQPLVSPSGFSLVPSPATHTAHSRSVGEIMRSICIIITVIVGQFILLVNIDGII